MEPRIQYAQTKDGVRIEWGDNLDRSGSLRRSGDFESRWPRRLSAVAAAVERI